MKMPFGKYRGKTLDEIPEDYLCWVLDNCTNVRPSLREAIRTQLGIDAPPPPPPPPPPASTAKVDAAILSKWYRQLAKEFHPDMKGGTNEGMKAVNRANELLKQLLA